MKIAYNNEIKQVTFLDERFYFDDKTESYFPSITTILDVYPKGYGYIQWLKDLGNNAEEVLRRAGEQGSNVHSGIERFLKGEAIEWVEGEKDNFTLDEWIMICRFIDFYKTFKPRIIAIEVSLVSSKLGYGGTLDLVCEINDEIWYIDYKSGNAIYKSHKLQAVACKEIWNEQMPEKITRIGCLHLKASTRGAGRNGTMQGEKWKVDEATEHDKLLKLFKHSHDIWLEENPNPKPKNLVYPSRFELKEVNSMIEKGEKNAIEA